MTGEGGNDRKGGGNDRWGSGNDKVDSRLLPTGMTKRGGHDAGGMLPLPLRERGG